MKRYNPFRQFFSIIALCSVLLFAVGCNDQPAPGPMSPVKPADKLTSSRNSSTSGTVRPVQRLENNASPTLAKSGYNQARVVQQLQDVRAEMKAIVAMNPGTSVAYKLNSAVGYVNGAITNLPSHSSDDDGDDDDGDDGDDDDGDDDEEDDDDDDDGGDANALYNISRAKAKVQEAINNGLLLSAQGTQFKNQLGEIENQIKNGYSPAGDFRGQSKSLWIKRNYGGLITFGGHTVEVPKYATKQDALFTINISQDDYVTVDFGPDGTFDKPVEVTISYEEVDLTGVNPNNLTLAWFDESANQWNEVGGIVDVLQKTVTALVNHFTQYTISTK